MVAARKIGEPSYTEKIGEMDRELTKFIEDVDPGITFKPLRMANETSKPSFSQSVDS